VCFLGDFKWVLKHLNLVAAGPNGVTSSAPITSGSMETIPISARNASNFATDHNERRSAGAPPCVRYTCNVHSESENKSQMICEADVYCDWSSGRDGQSANFYFRSSSRLFSKNEDVDGEIR
jgi:hypothetical protein